MSELKHPTDRSPRYPRMSVLEAAALAKKLYDGVHRSSIDTNTAYRVLGFAGKNGASATALGAIRQFGLVDGLRGTLRLSELGLTLLEPSSRQEYVEALEKASFKPGVFADLYSNFGGLLPKSDEPLRAYLIRTAGFSKAGADDCIASLRRSNEEVAKERGNDVGQDGRLDLQGLRATDATAEVQAISGDRLLMNSPPQGSGEFIRIPLTRECAVEVRFSGLVTEDALTRLQGYIELMKPIWAE